MDELDAAEEAAAVPGSLVSKVSVLQPLSAVAAAVTGGGGAAVEPSLCLLWELSADGVIGAFLISSGAIEVLTATAGLAVGLLHAPAGDGGGGAPHPEAAGRDPSPNGFRLLELALGTLANLTAARGGGADESDPEAGPSTAATSPTSIPARAAAAAELEQQLPSGSAVWKSDAVLELAGALLHAPDPTVLLELLRLLRCVAVAGPGGRVPDPVFAALGTRAAAADQLLAIIANTLSEPLLESALLLLDTLLTDSAERAAPCRLVCPSAAQTVLQAVAAQLQPRPTAAGRAASPGAGQSGGLSPGSGWALGADPPPRLSVGVIGAGVAALYSFTTSEHGVEALLGVRGVEALTAALCRAAADECDRAAEFEPDEGWGQIRELCSAINYVVVTAASTADGHDAAR